MQCPATRLQAGASAACSTRQTTIRHAAAPAAAQEAATEFQATSFLRPHLLDLAPYTPIEPFEVRQQHAAAICRHVNDICMEAHGSRALLGFCRVRPLAWPAQPCGGALADLARCWPAGSAGLRKCQASATGAVAQ